MKKLIVRGTLIFALGFSSLFCLRLAYGYVTQPNGEVVEQHYYSNDIGYDFHFSRKNYAGQNSAAGAAPLAVDQRYEKVATLGQSSSSFSDDESKIRGIVDEAEALIQHEQAYGLDGRRQLQLALGVQPKDFDAVIEQLRVIGTSVNFQVNKIDKTNEYRALLAQQESLKKSRDSLAALKSRDADLADLITLESRILELENQIQSLGVSVGEFDSEFEFVTIKLTLSEVPPLVTRFIPFLQRAKVAMEWTVWMALGISGALLLFLGVVALITLVAQMAKKLAREEGKPEQKAT